LTPSHRGRASAGPPVRAWLTSSSRPAPFRLLPRARRNNLRDIDVDVPLWRTVGVSGSGKTSLAIGTLYAEGTQRFLAGLSTYSRRRLAQAQRRDVDRIDHVPPALALRQRQPVPGPRSTVGTISEVQRSCPPQLALRIVS